MVFWFCIETAIRFIIIPFDIYSVLSDLFASLNCISTLSFFNDFGKCDWTEDSIWHGSWTVVLYRHHWDQYHVLNIYTAWNVYNYVSTYLSRVVYLVAFSESSEAYVCKYHRHLAMCCGTSGGAWYKYQWFFKYCVCQEQLSGHPHRHLPCFRVFHHVVGVKVFFVSCQDSSISTTFVSCFAVFNVSWCGCLLAAGAHPAFFLFWGGGGWLTLRLYIIFFYFQNYVVSTTWHCLQLHLYTCEYNYMFHDSITVSCLLVFFNFINLFLKI
jgi:hypothetical protein